MKYLMIILYLIFTIIGLFLIKSSSNNVNFILKNGIFNFSIGLKMLFGLILYICSFIIYSFYIVKKFDLSYIYPIITGITQILVIVGALLIFKEKMNIYGFIGSFIIIIGVILLNIK